MHRPHADGQHLPCTDSVVVARRARRALPNKPGGGVPGSRRYLAQQTASGLRYSAELCPCTDYTPAVMEAVA